MNRDFVRSRFRIWFWMFFATLLLWAVYGGLLPGCWILVDLTTENPWKVLNALAFMWAVVMLIVASHLVGRVSDVVIDHINLSERQLREANAILISELKFSEKLAYDYLQLAFSSDSPVLLRLEEKIGDRAMQRLSRLCYRQSQEVLKWQGEGSAASDEGYHVAVEDFKSKKGEYWRFSRILHENNLGRAEKKSWKDDLPPDQVAG